MDERNTWGWVVGGIVAIVVIGGLVWWLNQSTTANTSGTDMASTTDMTVSSTTTSAMPTAVTVNDSSSKSIATIVAGLSDSSEYASYFVNTGIGATLGARGPYTVFVSTDAGFGLLKPGTITNMTAAQKKRLIQYSVVSGRELDVNTQNNGSVKALSGDELNFVVNPSGQVQVNSSYALAAYKASNGIVYVINQPLLPPTSGNIMTP